MTRLFLLVATIAYGVVLAAVAPPTALAYAPSQATLASAAVKITGPIYYDANHNPFWRGPDYMRHYVSRQVANFYLDHHWSNVPRSERHWPGRTTPGS